MFYKIINGRNVEMKKCYLLLTTCTSTRAVHLEVTSDVNANSLLLALRRFIARRGIPNMIISDNFKTFKSQSVKAFCKVNGIKWKIYIRKIPLVGGGGFYERLIGIVKNSLKKILGRARLTYNEIQTFICEIENIVNTRPLTYLSEENFDEPLTPYHLLHGRNLTNKNHFTITKNMTDNDARTCRERIQTLVLHFKKCFHQEYLAKLQERQLHKSRKFKNSCTVKVGDVVLIKDVNKPQNDMAKRASPKIDRRQRYISTRGRDKGVSVNKGQNSNDTTSSTINCSP